MPRKELKAHCTCGSCWTLPVTLPCCAEEAAEALLQARCGLCRRRPRVYIALPPQSVSAAQRAA